jgi:hypothetical protein
MVPIRVAESVRTGSVSTRRFQTFDAGKGKGQPVRALKRLMFGVAETDPPPTETARVATTKASPSDRRARMPPSSGGGATTALIRWSRTVTPGTARSAHR